MELYQKSSNCSPNTKHITKLNEDYYAPWLGDFSGKKVLRNSTINILGTVDKISDFRSVWLWEYETVDFDRWLARERKFMVTGACAGDFQASSLVSWLADTRPFLAAGCFAPRQFTPHKSLNLLKGWIHGIQVMGTMWPASAASEASEAVTSLVLFGVSKRSGREYFSRSWQFLKVVQRPQFRGTVWPQIWPVRSSEAKIPKLAIFWFLKVELQ